MENVHGGLRCARATNEIHQEHLRQTFCKRREVKSQNAVTVNRTTYRGTGEGWEGIGTMWGTRCTRGTVAPCWGWLSFWEALEGWNDVSGIITSSDVDYRWIHGSTTHLINVLSMFFLPHSSLLSSPYMDFTQLDSILQHVSSCYKVDEQEVLDKWMEKREVRDPEGWRQLEGIPCIAGGLTALHSESQLNQDEGQLNIIQGLWMDEGEPSRGRLCLRF